MLIQVKDLLPNPHRRIAEYPYDPVKITTLTISFNETFFWDNILARKAPNNSGKYEIAYGHHRLKVLKDLKIKEVDIPVKDLTDGQMLKIMADENSEDYGMLPAVLNETIKSVKIYLDDFIKGKSYQDIKATSPDIWRDLFKSERALTLAKSRGVGEKTIQAFLGKNWSRDRIISALAAIRADETTFDRKAAESMPSVQGQDAFRKTVKLYNIPKKEQTKIAANLKKKKEKPSAPEIRKAIRQAAKPKTETPKKDPILAKLEKDLDKIESDMATLTNRIAGFCADAKSLEVKEVDGLSAAFSTYATNELLREIKRFLKLFGYKDYQIKQIGGK